MSNIIKGPLNMCYSTERFEDLKITKFKPQMRSPFYRKEVPDITNIFISFKIHRIGTPLIATNQF